MIEGVAPDGTELHVQRNHGKPTKAQELAKALADARKAKKGKTGKATPASRPATEDTEAGRTPAVPGAAVPAKTSPNSAELSPDLQSTPLKPASADAVSSVAGGSSGPSARRKSMQVRFTGMKPMHVVEAALFAAGKPITVDEIAEQTGLPPDKVKDGIRELQSAYQDRDTVPEVGKAGTKWAMQVRAQAAEPAARFAPMEIAPKLLKTLALIAFHQPMKQSLLVEMMGSKVYDHIPELVQRGLVRAREDGPTKILGTTALFPEYFGLDASDPDEIRALMGRLVGIEAPPKPKAETVYEEPQPQGEPVPEPAPQTPPAH
ncbi:MAG: segregation and condensation protein [Thermoplasmata archaeon]|nr:segregation and condensation protein [Thermoplasmata archaeon]